MFNHGVDYIDVHRPTGDLLKLRCLCGAEFYPTDKESVLQQLNRHISSSHEMMLQAHLDLNLKPRR